MTPEIVARAVNGLVVVLVLCIVGIVVLAATGHQTEASLTSLSTLGGGAAGALAALLTSSTAPGAIVGGRRITDPRPASGEPAPSIPTGETTTITTTVTPPSG